MASVYEARTRNAERIATLIQDYIDKGYLVMDGDGEVVSGIDRNHDFGIVYKLKGSENCSYGLYNHDREMDDGAHTPIADFNKGFADWKVLDPRDLKPLV